MGKIIHLQRPTKEEWTQEVIRALSEGKKIAVAIECDGYVETAYWQCDWADKQVLIGHLQADVIDGMIQATYGLSKE